MLPGVDITEMLLLGVVALVLMGPRDLPLMMRKLGRFTGKMRAMAFEFRQSFDELGRQAELEELKKEVAQLRKDTGVDDLQKDLEKDQRDMEKDIVSSLGDPELTKVKAGIHPAAGQKAVETQSAPEAAPPVETAAEPAGEEPAAEAESPQPAHEGASR